MHFLAPANLLCGLQAIVGCTEDAACGGKVIPTQAHLYSLLTQPCQGQLTASTGGRPGGREGGREGGRSGLQAVELHWVQTSSVQISCYEGIRISARYIITFLPGVQVHVYISTGSVTVAQHV